LWDIIGKAEGKPIWIILGGTEPRLKAYASLGQRRNRDETIEAVRVRMAEDFPAVKLCASGGRIGAKRCKPLKPSAVPWAMASQS
jgi:L-alanine-DL-glutamate epimerase-like enolase superfamily enzyme